MSPLTLETPVFWTSDYWPNIVLALWCLQHFGLVSSDYWPNIVLALWCLQHFGLVSSDYWPNIVLALWCLQHFGLVSSDYWPNIVLALWRHDESHTLQARAWQLCFKLEVCSIQSLLYLVSAPKLNQPS